MNPIAYSIGPFDIYWYGILMALAFLTGYFILSKFAKEDGLSQNLIEIYFVYIFLGIVIGARLGEVLFYEPGYYFANPIMILHIWEGGLASHGAFLGGIIATLLFCWRHKVKFYRIADIAVIPIALGSVFIRIANFINGEIVGRVTDVSWAVKFENYEGLRHPSQIYEAIMNFAVFLSLLGIRRLKKIPEGFVFWSFVLIYSFLRFFIEFFKEYQAWSSSSLLLTEGQWLSIIFFAVATTFVLSNKKYVLFLKSIIRQ